MGTNLNFKWMPGSMQRQSSIYSLTFDELQNTTNGMGKDFGSMNMDELLKSIWSAEENQNMMFTNGGQQDGLGGSGNGRFLQKQGSLTLPRTLSLKKVDEVWKDISKEYKDGSDSGGLNITKRQQTLGEMTLEEFLFRAGVVKEDIGMGGKPNNGDLFGNISPMDTNNNGLEFGFQQMGQNTRLVDNKILDSSNQISVQPLNLPLNVNGFNSNQQQLLEQQVQAQPQIFPKQPVLPYTSQMPLTKSTQLGSPGINCGILGISDQAMNNASLVQNGARQGGGMGMIGFGGGIVTVGTCSPANQISSDGTGKSEDTSPVLPATYAYNNGCTSGRRSNGAIEKVVERRQRRMIKNRESAARSRARKQAYSMELEAEVAKLKAANEEMQKNLEQMMEMEKNKDLETATLQRQGKKQCLRRTLTGVW